MSSSTSPPFRFPPSSSTSRTTSKYHTLSLPSLSSWANNVIVMSSSSPTHTSSPTPKTPLFSIRRHHRYGQHEHEHDSLIKASPSQAYPHPNQYRSPSIFDAPNAEDDLLSDLDVRSTYFQTSAERGQWKDDPMAIYARPTSIPFHPPPPPPTQQLPTKLDRPPPMPIVHRHSASISIASLCDFTDAVTSPVRDTPYSDAPNTLPSLSSDRASSLGVDVDVEIDQESPCLPSPLPPSSPILSPTPASVHPEPVHRPISPLNLTNPSPCIAGSSPLSSIPSPLPTDPADLAHEPDFILSSPLSASSPTIHNPSSHQSPSPTKPNFTRFSSILTPESSLSPSYQLTDLLPEIQLDIAKPFHHTPPQFCSTPAKWVPDPLTDSPFTGPLTDRHPNGLVIPLPSHKPSKTIIGKRPATLKRKNLSHDRDPKDAPVTKKSRVVHSTQCNSTQFPAMPPRRSNQSADTHKNRQTSSIRRQIQDSIFDADGENLPDLCVAAAATTTTIINTNLSRSKSKSETRPGLTSRATTPTTKDEPFDISLDAPPCTSPISQALKSELYGLVIEALATSRASSLPLSNLTKAVVTNRPSLLKPHAGITRAEDDWSDVFLGILEEGQNQTGIFGKVESSFKDGTPTPNSSRPLKSSRGSSSKPSKAPKHSSTDARWFYIPEHDPDQDRASVIKSMMPRPGKRSVTMKYKQYYWKPVGKRARGTWEWDEELEEEDEVDD